MTQYPNTPSIINLARIPLEGIIEVSAYQFDAGSTDTASLATPTMLVLYSLPHDES